MVIALNMNSVTKARVPVRPIGIVIPTYNRAEALITCLRHLEQQTMTDFEVVLVDDGSTDTTPQCIEQFQQQTSLQLRYVRQPNSGPARARNRGISMLNAPICLLLGDDIFASSDFVATHLLLHQQRPEHYIAGLGLTKWSETAQNVTKFMRWLDTSGVQFAYGDLLNGILPDWRHFYTSNLSIKTELLRRFPFNATFPYAAMEDMELGYRIQAQHGLEVMFIPKAVAYHLHPTSFRGACKRMLKVGASSQLMYELWPELRPTAPTKVRQYFYGILLRNPRLIQSLTYIADILTHVWCPNPFMRVVLKAHYLAGTST